MHHYEITELKAINDALSARKKALTEVAIPFKNGLLDTLDSLTQSALQNGLPGIQTPKRLKDNNDFLEVTLTLNHFDLVLVSNYDAFPSDSSGEALVLRLFVYPFGSDEYTPLVEISIQEFGDKAFQYKVDWYTTEGKSHLNVQNSVTQQDGSQAAVILFDFFYSWKHTWAEKPKLAAIRGRNDVNQLGFRT